MTYDLAKQLKDAGFPQSGQGGCVDEFGKEWDSIHNFSCAWAYLPTLEELIEACGEGMHALIIGQPFMASGSALVNEGTTALHETGLTATEAVARLWLALNQK